jgi:hypothetical protein
MSRDGSALYDCPIWMSFSPRRTSRNEAKRLMRTESIQESMSSILHYSCERRFFKQPVVDPYDAGWPDQCVASPWPHATVSAAAAF